MKNVIIVLIILSCIIMLNHHAASQAIRLAFIGDKSAFGDHNKPALEWAEKTYGATLIHPDDVSKTDLTKYAVVWWHDGDNDPTPLASKPAISALKDYIQKGGAVLLSAAAEKLANELGIESGVPRIYGPGADNQAAGVTIREDTAKHPVWEGFNLKPGERIQVTSVGYPKSSDYWSLKFVEAVTIGNCWETGSDWKETVGAFVEWNKGTGKGIVFGMGWRLPHWKNDNKDRAALEKLTTNVINYLAKKSLFFSVNPNGRIITTWAWLKTP